MCTVSAVYDYGRKIEDDKWTRDMIIEFKKLVDAAKAFDEKTGQPDCEDPKKKEWIEIVERKVEE